jgi:hypothetical protein
LALPGSNAPRNDGCGRGPNIPSQRREVDLPKWKNQCRRRLYSRRPRRNIQNLQQIIAKDRSHDLICGDEREFIGCANCPVEGQLALSINSPPSPRTKQLVSWFRSSVIICSRFCLFFIGLREYGSRLPWFSHFGNSSSLPWDGLLGHLPLPALQERGFRGFFSWGFSEYYSACEGFWFVAGKGLWVSIHRICWFKIKFIFELKRFMGLI